MELRGELQRAIERRELVMHYQPIVALATGELRGFEALVRWQHPEHGLILPNEFVSLAEEAGLIGAMGSWILEEACRQFCEWVAAYPQAAGLYVSVNLSGHQLHRGNLLSELERVIEQTGIQPSRLLLELTESVLVDDTERAIARLEMIKRRGMRIAIDDFGTGFSALAYLQQLPIDVLKLASPFVQGLGDGPGAAHRDDPSPCRDARPRRHRGGHRASRRGCGARAARLHARAGLLLQHAARRRGGRGGDRHATRPLGLVAVVATTSVPA